MPAPSLRELDGLTSESGGSGGIGVDGRVTEVTERFGMGLEVAEGFGGCGRVWRLRKGLEVVEGFGGCGDLSRGAVMRSSELY